MHLRFDHSMPAPARARTTAYGYYVYHGGVLIDIEISRPRRTRPAMHACRCRYVLLAGNTGTGGSRSQRCHFFIECAFL